MIYCKLRRTFIKEYNIQNIIKEASECKNTMTPLNTKTVNPDILNFISLRQYGKGNFFLQNESK